MLHATCHITLAQFLWMLVMHLPLKVRFALFCLCACFLTSRSVFSESLVTMETRFGERPNAEASIPSPQSEAVASELQGLSLKPVPNLPPVRERTNVLQLKLQQRRSREELVKQGIMPPLKGSAAFHEQRRSLERARTEDYLKRKIRSRPERSELIRMHILEETTAEPSLQFKQLQLKRTCLADDLNDKISHRPGPMELIHKNILPIPSSIKQAIIEKQFPRASGDNSSCDEDSNYSLSPEEPVNQESPLGLLPLPSPPETLTGSSISSPTQVLLPVPNFLPISGSSPSLKLTNGTTAPSTQTMDAISQVKSKPNSALRHKKPKDNKPKIKKFKYHQYIPPDQKGDKEPPAHLDSSYAKILQQQQLFLQLQILNQQQQQQHCNYQAILPAPAKPESDHQLPTSCSSNSITSSLLRPVTASLTASSNQGSHSHHSSAPLGGTKPASLPPNLDEMKVAELKSELKLRSLPVSGTKNDLIERLRTYQELNGGSDTTSSPTAGGTTGPGAEGAGKSSKTAVSTTSTNNNTSHTQQFQFQCQQTSSLTGSSANPQQSMTFDGTVSSSTVSFLPSAHLPDAISPEDTTFNCDSLGEMVSPPPTQLSLQPCSAAQLPISIKEEPKRSTPVTCQFSLKTASMQKHHLVSSAAPITTTTAPVVTMDKDKMLQEKDKQIEELTRMLKQKQRLVEMLRMQLEHGKSGGRGSEPLVLVRVKQEPSDKSSVPLSFGHPPLPRPQSSVPREMDVSKLSVKKEATGAEEVTSETMQLPDTHGLLKSITQAQEVQIKAEQKSTQTKQQQHICLQQTTLQFAHQQAIQKLLLHQQHNIQNQQRTIHNHSQMLDNQQSLQKLSQQRKKKTHKQYLKQQHQHQHSKQHQHQMQVKKQILLKQQKLVLKQQVNQKPQTKQEQQIQIQTKIHLKQQQVLIQQKHQAQQQSPQVSQMSLNQQSGSAPSLPLDLIKSDSNPTLVTDSNGNHFLIALTGQITESLKPEAPESKATNQITLQCIQSTPAKIPGHNPVQLPKIDSQTKQSMHLGFCTKQKTKPQNVGLQICADQSQKEVSQCLSGSPSMQSFFKDHETAPSGKNTSPPSTQIEVCPGLNVSFGPLSPASIKTAASSPDSKDTEHDDIIDIILETGAPDPSLDHLNPNSLATYHPPPPLQLLLSGPIPPGCDTPQAAPSVKSELQTLSDSTNKSKHLDNTGSVGRLEDFLESTTGKPLLGVEPGGLLTLIDDLHSQMLCTPSILDHPPSPMDTSCMAEQGDHELDCMDWLDLTMGGVKAEEAPELAPLGPQTPTSVFSTDFLDSYDLQTHWDSCL